MSLAFDAKAKLWFFFFFLLQAAQTQCRQVSLWIQMCEQDAVNAFLADDVDRAF